MVLFFLSGSLNHPGTLSPLIAFSGVARDFHLPEQHRPQRALRRDGKSTGNPDMVIYNS